MITHTASISAASKDQVDIIIDGSHLISIKLKEPVLDPILMEIACGWLMVGRLHLSELYLYHVPKRMAALLEEAGNYMADHCNKPHTFKVICCENKFEGKHFIPEEFQLAKAGTKDLLLSGGGLDSSTTSLLLAYVGIPFRTLFFNYGQAARMYEWESVQMIDSYNAEKSAADVESAMLQVNLHLVRRGLKAFDNISNEGSFPCRNWFLYFAALAYAKEIPPNIFINIFKGEFDDNHRDHSPRTFELFNKLVLEYNGVDCRLVTPFKELDKSDLAYLLVSYFPDVDIAKIRSCYAFFRRIDGACTGCVNKFVSVIHAGFTAEEFGDSRIKPYRATKLWQKYYPRMFDDTYPISRRSEIAFVISQFLEHAPFAITEEKLAIMEQLKQLAIEEKAKRNPEAVLAVVQKAIAER